MKKILFFFVLLLVIPGIKAKTIEHSYAEIDRNATFKDDVNGTAAIAGDNIESSGSVFGVNFLAGNNVKFSGQSDYLAIFGNVIDVSGKVNYDGFIAGNIINIKKDSNFNRDVVIAGADVEVSGNFGRNVTIYAGTVNIKKSNITGYVKVFAEEIKIDDESMINKLYYPSDASVLIGSNVKKIIKTKAIKTNVEETFLDVLSSKIWSIMSYIFIFALLTIFAPKIFDKINRKYKKLDFNLGVEVFTKGLVFMIIVPIISLFSLMLPFGIPFSLIVFALYFIIIYLAKLFTGYLIGFIIYNKYVKKDLNVLLTGLIGFSVLFILDFIPIVSGITLVFSLLFGVGIIIDILYNKKNLSND